MLWEHEPQASVSTAFSSSPKPSRVFLSLDRNTKKMFSISFRKQPKENNEKRRKLDSFIYHQNVHSLYHAIYTSFKFTALCFYRVIETRLLTNQREYFPGAIF